jgi:N-acetylneuraminic acid mutarotase/chitodextrinase
MSELKKISSILFAVLILIGYAQAQSLMSWSPAPSLRSSRDSAAAVVANKGNIYVLGGNTNSPLSVDLLANGAANWTAAPPLTQARLAPGAIFAPNGQIFVFGGKSNGRALKETFYYNPATGAASNQASMKSLRYRFASVNAYGLLYVFGGLNTADQQIPSVEVYSPSSNKWGVLPDMPEARSNFSAVIEGSYMMTFGGSIAGNAATNTVYRYPYGGGGTFTPLAPMPVATRDSAVVLGANRLLYVIGGFSATGTPLNTVQIYDIATDSWRLGSSLPVGVGAANAVINEAGNIVVMGGIDSSNNNTPLVWTSPQADAPPVITSFPSTYVVAGSSYGYQLSASGNPASTFSLITSPNGMTINGNGLISWTPTLAQVGSQNVTVRATNPAGFTDQSFTVSVAPPPPTGMIVSDITTNSANLSWNSLPPEAGAVTYRLYQLVRGSTRSGPSAVFVAETASTSYSLSNLVSGAGFVFFVTAKVNGIESQRSIGVSFSTLQPAAPVGVTVTGQTQSSVSLAWSVPATTPVPIAGYRVYGYSPTTFQLVILVDNITGTTATVNGLLPNTSYQFYVASFDAASNSSFLVAAPRVITSSLPTLFHTQAFVRPPSYGGGFFPETLSAVNGGNLMLVSADAHSSAPVNYVVSATGMPQPTFSMVSGPAGMTIDAVTGVVSWTNVDSPVGMFSATVRGTNAEGSADFTFNYTVYPAGTDLLSPTEPAYFQTNATNVTSTSATINWTAATDNVAVAGYRIYVSSPPPFCGRTSCLPPPTNITPAAVVDGNTTSVTLNNLIPNSGYGMWIVAFDAAGNTSFVTAAVRPGFSTLP